MTIGLATISMQNINFQSPLITFINTDTFTFTQDYIYFSGITEDLTSTKKFQIPNIVTRKILGTTLQNLEIGDGSHDVTINTDSLNLQANDMSIKTNTTIDVSSGFFDITTVNPAGTVLVQANKLDIDTNALTIECQGLAQVKSTNTIINSSTDININTDSCAYIRTGDTTTITSGNGINLTSTSGYIN
jgi:hypothetical protein